jgi:hypothetical protein
MDDSRCVNVRVWLIHTDIAEEYDQRHPLSQLGCTRFDRWQAIIPWADAINGNSLWYIFPSGAPIR